MPATKAKLGINSLLPSGRQMFSHYLKSRASSHVAVTWEDKCHNYEHPPFLLFPPAFIDEHGAIWYGISLWLVWVSSSGYVLSRYLAHPQPTC